MQLTDEFSLAFMDEIPVPERGPHPHVMLAASEGWSPARVAYLARRWAEGATGQQIADELSGVSRSAVLGKVSKLGLVRAQPGKLGRPRLSTAQAEESARAYLEQHGPRHTRKAYAALGDDVTFSRFVKVDGIRNEALSRQLVMDARHPAFIEGRSIFSRRGVKTPGELSNLLVSGHSNVKIGRDVRKGLFRGYRIFTLTLEERATCPRSCANWTSCYGNHMPYARRVDHSDSGALTAMLRAEVPRLLGVRGREGVLIRLHALGDFFSVDYVNFWILMLHKHPRLAVYGYTARDRDADPIGRAIAAAKARHGRRFAIRWSNGGHGRDCTTTILREADKPPTAFVCPEQTGRVDGCGKCGACWTGDKDVAFILH